MAPLKSSLSKSVGKLIGVFRDRDLSLRGIVQSSRFVNTDTPVTMYLWGAGGGDELVEQNLEMVVLVDLCKFLVLLLNQILCMFM